MKAYKYRRNYLPTTIVLAGLSLSALGLSGCFDSSTEQAPPPLEQPPSGTPTPTPQPDITAQDDTLSVPPDTAGVVSVLDNDSSAGGGTLTIAAFDSSGAKGGNISDNADGTFSYVPPAGFEGEDTFNYTVKDPQDHSATATVVVTVSATVIPNGQAFYTSNCGVCHAAGADDTTTAFNATDLAQRTNPLVRNISMYNGQYQLMGTFYDVSQQNIDELKAYVATLAP
jgi:mono/diheme cytochrome c family protein